MKKIRKEVEASEREKEEREKKRKVSEVFFFLLLSVSLSCSPLSKKKLKLKLSHLLLDRDRRVRVQPDLARAGPGRVEVAERRVEDCFSMHAFLKNIFLCVSALLLLSFHSLSLSLSLHLGRKEAPPHSQVRYLRGTVLFW